METYLDQWSIDPHSLSNNPFDLSPWLTWRDNAKNHIIIGDENDEGFVTSKEFIELVDWNKKQLKQGVIFKSGISFGKDSSVLLLALVTALVELKLEGITLENNSIIVHSSTGVDNPEVANLSVTQWNELQRFVNRSGIALDLVLAKPSFSQSFVGRVVTGRGLPTMMSSSARQCSMDLKVIPSTAAVRKHLKAKGLSTKTHNICLQLGSRDDEGAIRKASIDAHGGSDERFGMTQNVKSLEWTAYPIRHFTTQMIWEVLSFSGLDKVIPSFVNTYDETVRVYADSAGECVLMATSESEDQKRSACGMRHGCWSCLVIKEDKSLNNMLDKEEYSYLRPLSRIRNFLHKTHYDWDERLITNRSIDAWGYVKLQPDLYSFEKVRRLLHAMITADVWEKERAYLHSLRYFNDEMPKTEMNRRLCDPQFELVSQEDLLRVEFLWSFHQFSDRPWSALAIWNAVHNEDDYEFLSDVDQMETVNRSPQPKAKYLYVGKDWTEGGINQGLIDHSLEWTSFDSDHLRVNRERKVNGEMRSYQTMHVSISQSLSVSCDDAVYWIFQDPSFYLKHHDSFYNPVTSSMTLLRMGVIEIANGKIGSYQRMAERQQFFHSKRLTGRVLMSDLDAREDLDILSSEGHKAMKVILPLVSDNTEVIEDQLVDSVPEEEQWDLFSGSVLAGLDEVQPTANEGQKPSSQQPKSHNEVLDQILLF
ncbi:hypothetical protein [Vibrio agarivorans]|uniref:Phosphoadenosine phosphosulphate reductase domain-containing protein n=1 Tax=Vibrio agarivorans TaxID=153622 RepID=A0ABT7Y7D7_9VIBR|nr:hypothetical protein [Vibrio agarivorans]MDN2483971.1 hypothetical protein [Vibrio agarivorans]